MTPILQTPITPTVPSLTQTVVPSITQVDPINWVTTVQGCWPILLIALVFYMLIRYDKLIKTGLERATKLAVKKGDISFEVEREDSARDALTTNAPLQEPKSAVQSVETVIITKDDSSEKVEQNPSSKKPLERLFDAYGERDIDKLEKAYEELQRSETDAVAKLKNQAFYLYMLYKAGKHSALSSLYTMLAAADVPDSVKPRVHSLIGLAYDEVGQYKQSIDAFNAAVALEKDEEIKARDLVSLSQSLYKNGDTKDALDTLLNSLKYFTKSEAKRAVYEGLAQLNKTMNNLQMEIVFLEKAVQEQPNDTSLRFKLAYALAANSEFESLGLFHYTKNLLFDPTDPSTLNNAGVALDRLGLPIEAIKHYKNAFEVGNTLAASNLAKILLRVGFVQEAQKYLKEALKSDDVHPNVGSTLSEIATRQTAESEKLEQLQKAAEEQEKFLLNYCDAYISSAGIPNNVVGDWILEKEQIASLTMPSEGVFTISWEETDRYCRIDGVFKNLSTERLKYGESAKLNSWGILKSSVKALGYLNHAGNKFDFMIVFDGSVKYFHFNKKT